MQIPHNKFCPLPWISLETTPLGTVRACCLNREELRDNTGNLFDLNHADLTEIQNSTQLTQLRKEFLEEKQPES